MDSIEIKFIVHNLEIVNKVMRHMHILKCMQITKLSLCKIPKKRNRYETEYEVSARVCTHLKYNKQQV